MAITLDEPDVLEASDVVEGLVSDGLASGRRVRRLVEVHFSPRAKQLIYWVNYESPPTARMS